MFNFVTSGGCFCKDSASPVYFMNTPVRIFLLQSAEGGREGLITFIRNHMIDSDFSLQSKCMLFAVLLQAFCSVAAHLFAVILQLLCSATATGLQ